MYYNRNENHRQKKSFSRQKSINMDNNDSYFLELFINIAPLENDINMMSKEAS